MGAFSDMAGNSGEHQYVTEADRAADLGLAKDIAETLHEHYPGHLWAVNVTGGVVFIQNFYISSDWGMVIKYNNLKGSAGARKKRVVMAAGEFLERANMRRGKYESQIVGAVDGIKRRTRTIN